MEASSRLVIRQERPDDYEAVYELIRSAFLTAEHRDGNEQDLVAALRESEAFIPQLSLVAQEGEEILGYVLFTQAWAGKCLCWRWPRWLFRPKGSGRGSAVRLSGKGTALPGSWAMAMPPCWEARNTMPDLAMLPPAGMAFRLPREFLRRILWRFAYERMRAPWRELSSMPRNLEYNGKEKAQVGKNLCFF